MVNIMGADVLATKGARASASMIFTMMNWINSVSTLRVNSLAPGKSEWNLRLKTFKVILWLVVEVSFCEIDLRWMSQDFIGGKSMLVQVMAWCCQATSRYPSQCWPTFMSPYGITKPQWVNSLCAELISAKNIYTCISYNLYTLEMVQVVEILSRGRIVLDYPAQSIPWLLMTWCHKELGYQ